MNRQKQVEKRKARRYAQKLRHLEKQKQVEEEILDEEDEVLEEENEKDEETEAEVKEVSKEMYTAGDFTSKDGMMGMDSMQPMMHSGPTSWDELDAARQAQEAANELRELGWDVQDLVYNILGNPMMKPDEKAQAIQNVGNGFGERVTNVMATGEEDMTKDLDVLEIEAILAYDKRHSTPMDFISNIFKKKLSYAAEQKLSDADFALVTTRDGKKVRKYPIQDKAHVRNALARAAQQIKAGGEGAADAKAALPKIRAAAKKMGIEVSMEKEKNAVLVEKDASGQWRAVWWVSNNFIDWDGDIIAEDAHKEYIEWLDQNPDLAPASVTWHMEGTTRTHPMDFWAYENGFLIMSNPLEENEAVGLLKAKTLTDLGCSHGSLVFSRDEKDPRVITKYRMYEVSDLPLENAANPFTDFQIDKEVGMDKLKYLATIFGDEKKATAFMEKTGMKKKQLEEAGVEHKEKEEEKPVEQAASQTQAAVSPDDELVEKVLKQLDIAGLNEFVIKAQDALEKVPVLEALVKELQTGHEEKLAEMLTPPAARFAWSQKARASQAEETIVKKDDKLKDAVPGVPEGYWLSEATHTAPVHVE